MSVTCGVNSEAETADHPIFTCHHCGMPVCEQHGWVVTADDAFDDGGGLRSRGTRGHQQLHVACRDALSQVRR